MELKDNNEMGKMCFFFLEFSSKGSIELYAMVGCSPKEILALLFKPRKTTFAKEIIVLMRGSMATTGSNLDDKSMLVVVVVCIIGNRSYINIKNTISNYFSLKIKTK